MLSYLYMYIDYNTYRHMYTTNVFAVQYYFRVIYAVRSAAIIPNFIHAVTRTENN